MMRKCLSVAACHIVYLYVIKSKPLVDILSPLSCWLSRYCLTEGQTCLAEMENEPHHSQRGEELHSKSGVHKMHK